MRYYIYQMTNIVNGRKYVGRHQCECHFLDSSYYGSGQSLNRAIKKYGKENFKREVLIECLSFDASCFMENVYVGAEEVKDRSYYNLIEGGRGGITGYHHTDVSKEKIRKSSTGRPSVWKGKKLPQRTKEHCENLSKTAGVKKGNIPWNKGKPHTEAHKQALRDAWILRKERNK
jgi:group I intron endonuclease